MTSEYITKLKREVEDNDWAVSDFVDGYQAAIDTLNSRGLIVQEGFVQVPFDKPITNLMKAVHIAEYSFETNELLVEENENGEFVVVGNHTRENIVPWDLCKKIYKGMLETATQKKED